MGSGATVSRPRICPLPTCPRVPLSPRVRRTRPVLPCPLNLNEMPFASPLVPVSPCPRVP
jgi:hypothetical protein